ncbi:MAG: hypothetical protein AAF138_04055 [Planctomycetota bacterium]
MGGIGLTKEEANARDAGEVADCAESDSDGDGAGLVLPRTPEALHGFVTGTLGIAAPREALIAGHSAPFEYLCHVFFEGRGSWGGDARLSPDAIVWANRGGGKTFMGAVATALDLIFKPGIEVRLLGGSRDQSGRMYAHLRALFAKEALAPMVDGRITEQRLRLKNGSKAEILSQSHTSVRGTRVQKLRCDEVELFDESVWEAAQLTTQSLDVETQAGPMRVRGSVEALSTMHVPYGLMHRLIAEANQGDCNGRRRVFRWGVADVLEWCGDARVCRDDAGRECALWAECRGVAKRERAGGGGHLSIDDAIAMKGRVGSATWSAEMLSERPTRTDAVLPEFDPQVHVVDELPFAAEERAVTWLGGMDFGFRSPTVVLWACLDAVGRLWIVDERVRSGVIVSEHAEAMLGADRGGKAKWPTPEWLGVDPAGRQRSDQTGKSPVQVLGEFGLRVRDRRLGLVEGLTMLRARLAPAAGEPTLFVHRRCAKLIESLGTYRYHSQTASAPTPRKDGPDHAVDALRYLVQNLDAGRSTKGSSYL